MIHFNSNIGKRINSEFLLENFVNFEFLTWIKLEKETKKERKKERNKNDSIRIEFPLTPSNANLFRLSDFIVRQANSQSRCYIALESTYTLRERVHRYTYIEATCRPPVQAGCPMANVIIPMIEGIRVIRDSLCTYVSGMRSPLTSFFFRKSVGRES